MTQTAQIIVAGFHRSGTSMAMQALARAGVHVGHELIGADPSNADGHYEDVETVRLHDEWLSDSGSDWCHTGALPIVDSSMAAQRIKVIQTRFDKQVVAQSQMIWGIKDPRATLFLKQWFEHLNNPYGVFVYRHFASCLHSLQRRQANELLLNPNTEDANIRFWNQPNVALASWLAHNRAIIEVMKLYPDKCVLVSQEAQIAGTHLAPIVNERFNLSLETSQSSGVDVSKTRRAHSLELFSDELKEELLSTWSTLQSLAAAPAPNEPLIEWKQDDGESVDMESCMQALQLLWDKVGASHAA